jgi:RNA polymerase sigma-70 factor (ECF subfamily)
VAVALIDRLFGRPAPEHLVREHGPSVHRQLQRLFGPRADIDDVFQAVMVEVLRSLPAFEGRAPIGAWIRRITLHVAYQEMRVRCREREFASEVELDGLRSADDPEAELVRRRELEALYAALETLSPKKRIAVVLHDIEGHTLQEIADALGRPLQTVASQVRAGRAELAELFARRVVVAPPAQAEEGHR